MQDRWERHWALSDATLQAFLDKHFK
jgi:hypothetical protein